MVHLTDGLPQAAAGFKLLWLCSDIKNAVCLYYPLKFGLGGIVITGR